MTPKEKAKELINKFTRFHTNGVYSVVHKDVAKQFALIAVDELIEEAYFTDGYYDRQEYWEKVKQEIEKL